MRLDGGAVRLEDRSIIVGAEVAKKRSRRVVEMIDALIAWLNPVLPINGPIVNASGFRDNFDALKAAAKLTEWPHNGLRHSFGSYHLAFYGDAVKTAMQMGHRDSNVVHNHYKTLVLKSEAEKFWALRPKQATRTNAPEAAVTEPAKDQGKAADSRPQDASKPNPGM
jgi:integrase